MRRFTFGLALGVALLAILIGGCRYPVTEIVLRVETDIPQGRGQTLTDVRVEVYTRGEMTARYMVTHSLGTSEMPLLPADLGITPLNNDGTRVITVKVTAVSDGRDLFTYTATVPFEQGHITQLNVFLAGRCLDPLNRMCVPEMSTCGRFGCEAIERMMLPRFDPDASTSTDATIDAVVSIDAPMDSRMDVPADASCRAPDVICGAICTSVQSDSRNCGMCGNDCADLPGVDRSMARCVAGACVNTCVAGRADCDSMPANGCETDITTSSNCGMCARACTTPEICGLRAGVYACGRDCAAPTTQCGFACVNTASDPNHCGRCGMDCPPVPNATPTCTAGVCGFTCNAGFHLCGGVCVSNNAVATCGASCAPCMAPAHSTPTCVAGACGFVCARDFANCDGVAANGCETDLSSPSSCGSCTNTCPTTAPTCAPSGLGFVCVATCMPGGSCIPARECYRGMISCPTAGPRCDEVGPVTAGTPCAGGVCSPSAVCVPCVVGESCPTSNPCENGGRVCSTGVPTCTRSSFRAAGIPCPGGVCNGSGTCVPCSSGATCARPNPCEVGQIDCSSGSAMCTYLRPQSMGTPCGTGGTCDGAGTCSKCTPGGSCSLGECLIGQRTCPSGCMQTGVDPTGTPCEGGVCNSGTCVACSDGEFCSTNECWTEEIRCATGGPLCTRTGFQSSATPCSGGMCNGMGNCVPACTPGSPCDSGLLCRMNGMSTCPGCFEEFEPVGTPCGAGNLCDDSGNCVSPPRDGGTTDSGGMTMDSGPPPVDP